MKKFYISSLVLSTLLLNGCIVIGGVFKAGAMAGIVSVIVVIVIIIWIISMFRGRN